MPLRKLSKTTSKKLSKHLATSATHVDNLLDCFIATRFLVVGATHVDNLLNYFITTRFLVVGATHVDNLLDCFIATRSYNYWFRL